MAIPDPSEKEYPASGRAADKLGQGWKVRPFLRVNKGRTATLMDVDGPGMIQHIWMVEGLKPSTTSCAFYWDGEDTPRRGARHRFLRRRPRPVRPGQLAGGGGQPAHALNCYWPMPFRKHARVTITNDSDAGPRASRLANRLRGAQVPPEAGYFHAQFDAPRKDRARTPTVDPRRRQGEAATSAPSWPGPSTRRVGSARAR